jgi:glycosyltransferase involved in cell wall biosynthesis
LTIWPSVDVIIPAARASGTISRAIEAVRTQGYPNLGSVVVASSDRETAEIALAHGATVVANPSNRTPAGLNRALAATDGEIIARVDAHSVIPEGYLERAVSVLLETAADNVGGMQVPVGDTGWERAIAAAMSSRFGAGDARYRIGGVPGPTDTVYLGVFRRETLERLGGFSEEFERNQDYELNHRIRESGGVVWFDPELRVAYRPRGSLRELASQYFQYGQWKREFSRRHPASLRWRQLAPPLLTTMLALSLVVGVWWPFAWVAPGFYLAALFAVGLIRAPRLGVPALGMPIALGTMHLSWGLGFLLGRSTRSKRT